MRLCSFQGSDGLLPGLVDGDMVVPLANASSRAVITGADPVPDGAPMRFLVPGDVVRIEIDRLGAIEHQRVAA